MAHHNLDSLDKKILRLIAEDARIPFLEVARSCNVSGAAIHQRIQKLNSLGVLKGSQFIIDPEKIGYETCAYIGLNLRNPEDFDKAVEALKTYLKSLNVIIQRATTICLLRFTHSTITICSTSFTTVCSRWDCHEARLSYHSIRHSTDSCLLWTYRLTMRTKMM